MKILAVRGKNLASLEDEFEIDFTKEPLKSAGIFVITGNTGSGKSTLLDALCLALFDNTPRTSRAGENVSVVDVKDKTINQKDSRTILRRGASEGYAEVDFVSLGGETFRSTWSVKRARNKVDGSMQNTEIRLVNLSSDAEMPGRKTELLVKISELIGLTFDQFTRSVLLAQGDFAAFLKAKQSEKAELLEKLTGTEIYSRISATIYEKSKEAERNHQLLKEQIQGVELLSDEQIETLTSENKSVEKELLTIKSESDLLSRKIKWITDAETLQNNVLQAEKALIDTQKAIEEAKPRYDYMARIEIVREISDVFNDRKNTEKQLEENRLNLEKKKSEYESDTKTLMQAETNYAVFREDAEKLNREIDRIEPEVIKARALDVQITGAEVNAKDAENELKSVQSSNEQIAGRIQTTEKEIEDAKIRKENLSRWFEAHHAYRNIVPKADLIIALLDDVKTTEEQIASNRIGRKNNESGLKREAEKAAELKQESERLNKLLPAEIFELRTKLKDGTPCPVCGSLFHPMRDSIDEQSLAETELNKAKESVSKETAFLTENMNKRSVEIARLNALIETGETRLADARTKIKDYLSDLLPRREDFEPEEMRLTLKNTAEQWAKNTADAVKTAGIIDTKSTLLQSEQNNWKEAEKNTAIKKKKHADSVEILQKLQNERTQLLSGKSVDEVSARYAEQKKETAEKLKQASDLTTALETKQKTLKGIITQLTDETERLDRRCASLRVTIENWLNEKNDPYIREQLSELLTKDNRQLETEKQFLSDLKNKATIAEATLAERNHRLNNHKKAETRPESDEETIAVLSETIDEKNAKTEQNTKRLAEINVAFIAHHKGKEKIKRFEKELIEKEKLSENWKKLNDLLGSANGSKFKEMAQGYTLDALLGYANKHLNELSPRYKLQRIPDTLALQVVDSDMLEEIRTVHSLSGGESFLLSLSLALGLSSLSSDRMHVESLFIDEGFGALDIDTLRIAMDALERLQMQGRKIGVISHVAEMTERIVTRIEVVKMVNGRSRVVVGG